MKEEVKHIRQAFAAQVPLTVSLSNILIFEILPAFFQPEIRLNFKT